MLTEKDLRNLPRKTLLDIVGSLVADIVRGDRGKAVVLEMVIKIAREK